MDLGVLLKGELSRSGQNHYGLFVVYACLGWFVFLSLSFHITGEQKEGRIEIPYKFVLNPLSDTSFLTFSDSDSVLATLKENCKKLQADSRASFICPRKRESVSLPGSSPWPFLPSSACHIPDSLDYLCLPHEPELPGTAIPVTGPGTGVMLTIDWLLNGFVCFSH